MSYGNLKDFYNSNKFNKKLRERVNGFEPELSGSLWDRIEHDLDKKDNKHRRILALVYVLAGLLVLSSAGMLYFYNQQRIANNYLSENANTPTVQQAPAEGSDKSAPALNNNNEISSNIDEAGSDLENESTTALNNNAGLSSNTTRNQSTNRRPATQTGNENNTETPVLDQEQTAQSDAVESVESPKTGQPEETAKETKEAEYKPKEAAKEDSKETAEEPAKADKKEPKKELNGKGKWFVGAFYGYGQSNTAVSSPIAGLYSYENPLNVPEYGIEFSRRFNNIFIGSGVHFLETGEKLTYKYTPVTALSTIPVPSVQDSLIRGDSATTYNYQSWIQIPLNLGYILDIGKRFSVQGSVGMAYAMNTGYSGIEPNYGFSGFDPAGTFGNQYKSHFNFLGSLGIGYRITPRFSFVLAADYRKAVTSATKNDRPNHAERYPEFIGGKVSVFYRLK